MGALQAMARSFARGAAYVCTVPVQEPGGSDHRAGGATVGSRFVLAPFGVRGRRDASWATGSCRESRTKTEMTDPGADIEGRRRER